jgi:hypothetical protein
MDDASNSCPDYMTPAIVQYMNGINQTLLLMQSQWVTNLKEQTDDIHAKLANEFRPCLNAQQNQDKRLRELLQAHQKVVDDRVSQIQKDLTREIQTFAQTMLQNQERNTVKIMQSIETSIAPILSFAHEKLPSRSVVETGVQTSPKIETRESFVQTDRQVDQSKAAHNRKKSASTSSSTYSIASHGSASSSSPHQDASRTRKHNSSTFSRNFNKFDHRCYHPMHSQNFTNWLSCGPWQSHQFAQQDFQQKRFGRVFCNFCGRYNHHEANCFDRLALQAQLSQREFPPPFYDHSHNFDQSANYTGFPSQFPPQFWSRMCFPWM